MSHIRFLYLEIIAVVEQAQVNDSAGSSTLLCVRSPHSPREEPLRQLSLGRLRSAVRHELGVLRRGRGVLQSGQSPLRGLLSEMRACQLELATDFFTHTWSLGVEVQFYLAAPVILLAEKARLRYFMLTGPRLNVFALRCSLEGVRRTASLYWCASLSHLSLSGSACCEFAISVLSA